MRTISKVAGLPATLLAAFVLTTALGLPAASASSGPTFVEASGMIRGATVNVTVVEAGLQNQTQVHLRLTVDAWCENHGERYPKAANKQTELVVDQYVPVQDGTAETILSGTATLPDCPPSMDLEWQIPYLLEDLTNGISTSVHGFLDS